MTGFEAVVLPGPLALLPQYAGLSDPIPELRAACRQAVGRLAGRHRGAVLVVAAGPRGENVARGVPEPAGTRVARHLLAEAGFTGTVHTAVLSSDGGAGEVEVPAGTEAVVIVASGSAMRTEKAPGHLDDRAEGFDTEIGKALRDGDAATLRSLDAELGAALWCHDVPALRALGHLAGDLPVQPTVWFEDDPYGVAYWVGSWVCGSSSTD